MGKVQDVWLETLTAAGETTIVAGGILRERIYRTYTDNPKQ